MRKMTEVASMLDTFEFPAEWGDRFWDMEWREEIYLLLLDLKRILDYWSVIWTDFSNMDGRAEVF